MINNKYPITGQFHYNHKYLKFLKKLFVIDYQNIYVSIILSTKINMVLFLDKYNLIIIKKKVATLFLDLKKAFDVVDHDI